jgi:hypothetical protein
MHALQRSDYLQIRVCMIMLDSCSLDAKSNVLLSESSGTPVD